MTYGITHIALSRRRRCVWSRRSPRSRRPARPQFPLLPL